MKDVNKNRRTYYGQGAASPRGAWHRLGVARVSTQGVSGTSGGLRSSAS